MRSVSRNQVVNEWLELEQEKESSKEVDIDSNVPECDAVARLLTHKPDAASILWKHDLEWYEHEVTEEKFRTLRTVWEGRNIFDAAQALQNDDNSLSEDKIEKIKSIAENNSVEDLGPLFIYRCKKLRSGPFLADGNHRAVGIALQMLDGNNFRPQTAYVGYPAKAYSKQIRGLLHQLLNQL